MRIPTLITFFIFCSSIFGQTTLKWDIIDTNNMSISEMYSHTKMFIAKTWVSSNSVIQNDDKDGGVIFIKGMNIQNRFFALNDHEWRFSYSVKFMFKENRYRVIIDDVYCVSAGTSGSPWPCLPINEGYPEKNGLLKTSISKERYNDIVSSLHTELNLIINLYRAHMMTHEVSQKW
jgi:hypothetical protein